MSADREQVLRDTLLCVGYGVLYGQLLEFWTQRLILAFHRLKIGALDLDFDDPLSAAKRLLSELKGFETREGILAKKTLGNLFRELKREEGDWSGLEQFFEEILSARNHLIHSFFVGRYDLLVSEQLEELRSDANDIALKIESGMKAIKSAALHVSAEFGLGEDVIERKRHELLATDPDKRLRLLRRDIT